MDSAGPVTTDLASIIERTGFVHLHVHSTYSLREGALSVAKLAKLAVADAVPALALTDTNNLFGALEFSEKLAKEGVQPIIGLQLTLDFQDGPANMARGKSVFFHALPIMPRARRSCDRMAQIRNGANS